MTDGLSYLEQRVRDRIRNAQHDKITRAITALFERFPERDRPGVGATAVRIDHRGQVCIDDGSEARPDDVIRLRLDSHVAAQLLEITLLRETEARAARQAIDKLVTTLLDQETRTHG